jgi:hypothetical protein
MLRELVEVPPFTERTLQFARKLLEHQEPFIATARSLPPLTMTDDHLRHAELLLFELPEFSTFRYSSCPRRVSDERFWSAYFTLLASEESYRKAVAKRNKREKDSGHPQGGPELSSASSTSGGQKSDDPSATLSDRLRESSVTFLSTLTSSIASLVKEFDEAVGESSKNSQEETEKPSSADTESGVATASENSSPKPPEAQLPTTFYVAETIRPVSLSPPAKSPIKHMGSPVTSEPQTTRSLSFGESSSDSGSMGRLSKQIATLKLAPWWCQLNPDGTTSCERQSSDALDEHGASGDGFEWYC